MKVISCCYGNTVYDAILSKILTDSISFSIIQRNFFNLKVIFMDIFRNIINIALDL